MHVNLAPNDSAVLPVDQTPPGPAFMQQFVVYQNPSDFPGKWVVRVWDIGSGWIQPRRAGCVCDSRVDVRATIPSGLVCIKRHPADDTAIFEVWL